MDVDVSSESPLRSSGSGGHNPETAEERQARDQTPPVRTFTVRGQDGTPIQVELRRGPSGSQGMPTKLLVGLMSDAARAKLQATGCGAPMAEAMTARVMAAVDEPAVDKSAENAQARDAYTFCTFDTF